MGPTGVWGSEFFKRVQSESFTTLMSALRTLRILVVKRKLYRSWEGEPFSSSRTGWKSDSFSESRFKVRVNIVDGSGLTPRTNTQITHQLDFLV